MEKIESNPDVWSEICEKSNQLFEKAVPPELVSKFFSHPPFWAAKGGPYIVFTFTGSVRNVRNDV